MKIWKSSTTKKLDVLVVELFFEKKNMLDFGGGGWGWYPRRLTCYVEDLFRIQLLDIWVVTNQV